MSNAAGRLRRLADLPERGTKELGDMDSVARLSAVVLMQWAEENWRTLARCLADEHEALEALLFHAGMVVSSLEEQYEDDPGDKQARVQALALRPSVDKAQDALAATEKALAALGEASDVGD